MSTRLKILKARHGDAFILECKKDDSSFIMVIDSGPKLSIKDIVPQIKALPQVDLLVLTHYDEDHIGGFIDYFKKYPEDALKIKEYWCNCANQIEVDTGNEISAYENAKSFADSLRKILGDHHDIKWKELIKAGYHIKNEFVDVEVISPSEEAFQLNRNKYIEEQYPAISYRTMKDDLEVPLLDLAKRDTPKSSQVVNNASIAFILRSEDKSFLMLGDVMAEDVYQYLTKEKEGERYSIDNPLKVDFVKLSHHGSKFNISNDLLDIISCENFIISTNGGMANAYHPDREAIAKVLYHPHRDMNSAVHLYFNYNLVDIGKKTRIFNMGELEGANCIIHEDVLEL